MNSLKEVVGITSIRIEYLVCLHLSYWRPLRVCASINLWMKAAVSFERFIEIRFSAQGQNVINIKKTRIIIIAIVTFTVLWKICVFWKVCITLIN
ncbi:hypothetical protein HHI36_006804 [Cryptolaemus montrouzieri]|uniref:Uncharacterized protein n=1 Tax=Cryptolaemus montrouzieri TaxID=559131 RepID=A0ABD2NY75_9CUCU